MLRDTILAAGLALQQSGVIEPEVDVTAALDASLDGSLTTDLASAQ